MAPARPRVPAPAPAADGGTGAVLATKVVVAPAHGRVVRDDAAEAQDDYVVCARNLPVAGDVCLVRPGGHMVRNPPVP